MVDLSRERAQDVDPASPPPGQLPDSAWQQDVLRLVPPDEDTAHLDRTWGLTADSSPLENLTLWHPTDPGDLELRRVLRDFGHRVRRAEAPHTATLKELAFKDEVTGLYNRRFFSIRLEEEVVRYHQSKQPVSVVLLQLAGVARISHALGRDAHDATLRGVSDLLLKQTRAVNVVSRYDGGLFAIVMEGTSLGGARLYMERIRHALSSTTFVHGLSVIRRFGSASLPEDGAKTGQDLFRGPISDVEQQDPVADRESRRLNPPPGRTVAFVATATNFSCKGDASRWSLLLQLTSSTVHLGDCVSLLCTKDACRPTRYDLSYGPALFGEVVHGVPVLWHAELGRRPLLRELRYRTR